MAKHGLESRLAVVVHGLHKSGTMFLYQICFRLCRDKQIPFFSANHPDGNESAYRELTQGSFCVGPLRTFVTRELESPTACRIRRIFQIRDPRDILVSQYHSLGWRHTDAGFSRREHAQREAIQQLSIDDYVLEKELALGPLTRQFLHLARRPLAAGDRVVRYEQMVLDFPSWLAQFVEPFELPKPRWSVRKYAFRYRKEFRPDNDPTGHKRHVLPGNFRQALRPETIERLNASLADVLSAFDYPVETDRIAQPEPR